MDSRQAAAVGLDPNGILMEASKEVSDALKKLIHTLQEVSNKPNDAKAKEILLRAHQVVQASLQKLVCF